MNEIIFIVEESDEGGYIAKSVNEGIITQGEDLNDLRQMVKDAVRCHFDDNKQRIVRLHFIKEETFAA